MSSLLVDLAELFQETGHAHHAAFIDTDGVDAEWPLWYAEYLQDKLPVKLGAGITQSELIYLFITVDRELNSHAPGANWSEYYARFFIERYGE